MPEDAVRKCPRCQTHKPLDAFYLRRNGAPSSYCRVCNREYDKSRRQRADQAHLRELNRNSQLQTRYGISARQYDEMLERQRGACAGCAKTCPTGNRLAVDHDHVTGLVRGLLCVNCNRAVGHANDDPGRLRRLAEYLEAAA